MTDADILNPKLMAPRCAELWEWYKTVSTAAEDGANRTVMVRRLRTITDEIDAHAVEIEYQCRI